jgi:peptide/nickel transport system ATP-binding protein
MWAMPALLVGFMERRPIMDKSALVSVKNLTRLFDVSKPLLNRIIERESRKLLRAVDDVSFDIVEGETFALVGESGSGKSTVAKMVVGLLPPTKGHIRIDNLNLADKSQRAKLREMRSQIQMIFQDPFASLNPRWRVEKIIAEPVRAFNLEADNRSTMQRVDELLTLVGLDPSDGRKFPHEFSGGQRQRICIARALASKPKFIVCDEPTSALDVSVQAQILNLMRDLQDEFGLTFLFISHDLSVVRHMATRIGVMYLGRLVEVSNSKELFKAPKHPYTKMLLDAVPDLDMSDRERKPVEGEIPNPINPPSGCTFHPRCPFVNDRCRNEIPLALSANGSTVACHAVEERRLG